MFEVSRVLCTWCGDEKLHHVRVDVHGRAREDGDSVATAIGTDDPIWPTKPMPGPTRNPSLSRHGLVVCMYCEECEQFTELRIAQHKGMTLTSVARFELPEDTPAGG